MIVQVDPVAHASGLGVKLAFMRESGELCDFTIFVSGSEIKAHKCVLSATCDYFKTSFSFSDLSQALTQADFTHVGSDVKAVEMVIQSFYTNEIDLEPSCLEGILLLADYLMHDTLRLCIETYMESTLTFSTAVLYFRLALHYRLHSSRLFNNTKWFLTYRFHDYFVYQPDTLEANTDMLTAFMAFNIFRHCSLLQMVEFMLKNVRAALEKLHILALETKTDVSKEMEVRRHSTMTILSEVFISTKPELLDRWKPRLVDFMRTWRRSNLAADGDNVSELFWYVQLLELQLCDRITEVDCVCLKTGTQHMCYEKLLRSNCFKETLKPESDSFLRIVCMNPECELKGKEFIPAPHVGNDQPDMPVSTFVKDTGFRWGLCKCAPEKFQRWLANGEETSPEGIIIPEPKLIDDKTSLTNWTKTSKATAIEDNTEVVSGLKSSVKQSGDSPVTESADISVREPRELSGRKTASTEDVAKVLKPSHSATFHKDGCDILVVLAPAGDMTAQLLAADEETDRRLVRSPKLELCYYDIEMRTWRRGCKLDLPIPGAMLEKHSWRIAFFDSCLYMFSLGHVVGLQYNTLTNTWLRLECQNIFSPHGRASPVKSVIPIQVGRKLIVLAMSRESQRDGTFVTQQHYFEMQDDCRTFSKVASIQGDQLDMPVTQLTVCDNTLITVKSSTMVNRSLTHIQRIHLYDADTRVLSTHEAVCTMEAGVKIVARDQMIYLVNKDGWCRVYDFSRSTWGEMKRYLSMVTSTTWKHGNETTYPALTHVACHAGSSRWEVLSGHDSIHSIMLEITITSDGNLDVLYHPSPPFQFMTALCPSRMSRTQLDALEQPVFAQIDSLNLDLSYYNRMGIDI